jgi:hypothetical protein
VGSVSCSTEIGARTTQSPANREAVTTHNNNQVVTLRTAMRAFQDKSSAKHAD